MMNDMIKANTETIREGLTASSLVRLIKQEPENASIASRQLSFEDPFAQYYSSGSFVEPPLNPEWLLRLAEENPVHGACLEAVAADATGRGWKLTAVQGGPVQTDSETLSSQQYNLSQTLQNITPDLTFNELLRQAIWEMRAIGWAAWEVVRDQSGTIGAIYPLPAHTLRVSKDGKLFLQIVGDRRIFFKRFGDETEIDSISGEPFDETRTGPNKEPAQQATEVLFFKIYSPRTKFYGLPSWICSVPSQAEMAAIREYNISWFASGGMADRLIAIRAEDQAVADDIRQAIEGQLKASKGKGHKTIMVSGTPDVVIGIESLSRLEGEREGQFQERDAALVKQVLMSHSVPPYRIGLAELGSLGGSAAREMLRAYRFGAIEPMQTVIEDRLRQTLFGPRGLQLQEGVRWELLDVDFELVDLNLSIATRGVQNGYLTPSEASQLMGMEGRDDENANRLFIAGRPITGDVRTRETESSGDLLRPSPAGVSLPGVAQETQMSTERPSSANSSPSERPSGVTKG
jgi:PBSX family phage portal protein